MNKIFLKIGILLLVIILALFAISFISKISRSDKQSTIVEPVVAKNECETIQINILNSTKHAGIADISRNYMRNIGFDVVEIGNYAENQKKSYIIDRIGDKNASLKVAKAIGISDSMIISKIDSNLFISASVILGEDYLLLSAFK